MSHKEDQSLSKIDPYANISMSRDETSTSIVLTSLKQVNSKILQNLTQFEKDQLNDLFRDLNSLRLPKRPPGAFNLYLQTFILTQKQKGIYHNYTKSENEALKAWRKESEDVHSHYEQQAAKKFAEYQKIFQQISDEGEQLREKIEEIQNRADIDQIIKKKVSPYRVFKKDIASNIKQEFPNMKSQERQMIVKERWRVLTEKEKVLFVLKARLEEERLYYTQIQDFYKGRIEFSRTIPKQETKSHRFKSQAQVMKPTYHSKTLDQANLNFQQDSSISKGEISNQKPEENKNSSTTSSNKEHEESGSDKDGLMDEYLNCDPKDRDTREKVFEYEQSKNIINSTLRIIGIDEDME